MPLGGLGAFVDGHRGAAPGVGGLISQPTRLTPYRGVEHSIDVMRRQILSPRGAWSPLVRQVAERVVEHVAPKDYLSEALALRYWVLRHAPYLNDPKHIEWIRDPQALCEVILARGIVRCDCDEDTELLAALWLAVGRNVEFVTVGFDQSGQHSHVFARCEIPGTPRNAPKQWLVVDPVGGTRETTMLSKVTSFATYEVG